MSRSFRKTPICGMTTAFSEKDDKRRWHRLLRRTTRQRLSIVQRLNADDTFDLVLPHEFDVSDPWGFAKDGKQFFGTGATITIGLNRHGQKRHIAVSRRLGHKKWPKTIDRRLAILDYTK